MIDKKHLTKLGIELIILGIFVYLNDLYRWFTWPQFLAVLFVLKGLIIIFSKGEPLGPRVASSSRASKPKRRKRK